MFSLPGLPTLERLFDVEDKFRVDWLTSLEEIRLMDWFLLLLLEFNIVCKGDWMLLVDNTELLVLSFLSLRFEVIVGEVGECEVRSGFLRNFKEVGLWFLERRGDCPGEFGEEVRDLKTF